MATRGQTKFKYVAIYLPTGGRREGNFDARDSCHADIVQRSNSDGLGAFTFAIAIWNRQGDGKWLYYPAEPI